MDNTEKINEIEQLLSHLRYIGDLSDEEEKAHLCESCTDWYNSRGILTLSGTWPESVPEIYIKLQKKEKLLIKELEEIIASATSLIQKMKEGALSEAYLQLLSEYLVDLPDDISNTCKSQYRKVMGNGYDPLDHVLMSALITALLNTREAIH